MPKTYKPRSLRQKEKTQEEAWVICVSEKVSESGATDGPFSTEIEALNTVPEYDNSHIVHFFKDGSHEITWLWIAANKEWRSAL